MVDLSVDFVGVKAPNPFWLASGPPTDGKIKIERAFRAGWGGAVWKTFSGAGSAARDAAAVRYRALHGADRRVLALDGAERASGGDLAVDLGEIAEVKRAWPDRALIVSLAAPGDEDSARRILARIEATGCDGVELNFGCAPEARPAADEAARVETATRWCKAATRMPALVKLTPLGDLARRARAARKGGADALTLIDAVDAIAGIDLDAMTPAGGVGGMGGPAVKPIAAAALAAIAGDPETAGLPIAAAGGVTTWRDAAEFIALGAGVVEVCTAAMTYGFRIVDELASGLTNFMAAKGYRRVDDFRGLATANAAEWRRLDRDRILKAEIDQTLCIQCGRCHIACEDAAHQAIFAMVDGERRFVVNEAACVGCNLCALICPIENCVKLVDRSADVARAAAQ
jgi:dihydropyrimidine dehydrogenase (NAD+) subunit PreA